MITKAAQMHEDVIIKQTSVNAKKACRHIMQVNTSNKVLLGATQGIGNAILTTPLIQALGSLKLKVDILKGGFIRGAEKIFEGMPNVKLLDEDEIEGRIYLLGLQTIWPYPGLEKFVAQLRIAGNIFDMWKAGIPAHEVDVNMSLAYSLKYEGEIPPLYCHYEPVELPTGANKKIIGIHVCRKYSHQFYANRKLVNPYFIAEALHEEGFEVVMFGHKDSITDGYKQKYPDFNYFDELTLPQVAGLVKELDCVINEDSGIMHVTAAMDTPQVTIFGPTSWMKNRAWSDKAMLVRKDIDCLTCQYTERQSNCYSNICMDVSPSHILKCTKDLLAKFPK
ncbi:MAG: glycosyltransferase family 9 protein [Lentisphaerae bacterium]|nr:glycosyltransferase family 9 protein [Lentisphaerota bacterium]